MARTENDERAPQRLCPPPPQAPSCLLGLRERKKLRTRKELEETALALFAERGFDATTVEEVVTRVEVSPRTFFRYFASKEDVLLSEDGERRDQLMAALVARPAGEPVLTAVHRAVLSLAGMYETERDRLFQVYRLMEETPSLRARNLELQGAWAQALTAEVARRLHADPIADLLPRLVSRVALATLHAAVLTWFASGGRSDLPDLVDRAFAHLAGGIDVEPPG